MKYEWRTMVALEENSKRPATCHANRHWTTFSGRELDSGAVYGCNYGLKIPDNALVIDIDVRNGGKETFRELTRQYGACESNTVQRTPTGGLHLLFSKPLGMECVYKLGPGIEVLTGNHYIVVEPSTIDGKPYKWECEHLDTPSEIPPRWVDVLTRPKCEILWACKRPYGEGVSDNPIEDAERYIKKCPGAVSGSGGHNHTYAIVCKLREIGVSSMEAMNLLVGWNRTCSPPWSTHELMHKIKSVYK